MTTTFKSMSSRLPVFMSVCRPRSPYGTLMTNKWVSTQRVVSECHASVRYEAVLLLRKNVSMTIADLRQDLFTISYIHKVARRSMSPVLTTPSLEQSYRKALAGFRLAYDFGKPLVSLLQGPTSKVTVRGFYLFSPWDFKVARGVNRLRKGEVLSIERTPWILDRNKKLFPISIPAVLKRRFPALTPKEYTMRACFRLVCRLGNRRGFSPSLAPFSVR